jgi:hypothetical protein
VESTHWSHPHPHPHRGGPSADGSSADGAPPQQQGVSLGTLSLGDISLRETLGNRAAALRRELEAALGAAKLAQALAVAADVQRQEEAEWEEGGGGEGGAERLQDALHGVLHPGDMELASLLDELCLLEQSRSRASGF